MNSALQEFLKNQKEGTLVHFVISSATIIGKFSRIDETNESVILTMTSVLGETFFGETNVSISEIRAWGVGGKFV
jgi:hypothetical protein